MTAGANSMFLVGQTINGDIKWLKTTGLVFDQSNCDVAMVGQDLMGNDGKQKLETIAELRAVRWRYLVLKQIEDG